MLNLEKFRWPYREDTVFSILSFVVFTVPLAFSLFTNENFETIKFVLWLVCFGFALLLFLATKNKLGNKDKHFSVKISRAALWPLGVMITWSLASALLAPDKLYAFFGFYYRFTNGFLFYMLWALFLILLMQSLDRARWEFLIKILFFDALLVAIKGSLESVGISLYQGLSTEAFARSPSLLGNANFSSMFIACMLPLAVSFWKIAGNFWKKLYVAVSAFLMLVGLVVLSSRGALLALAAAVVVMLVILVWKSFDRRAFFLVIALAGVAVLLGAMVLNLSRPSIFGFGSADANVYLRLQVWRQTLSQGIAKHPVFGVGLGNFALFHERLSRGPTMGTFDDPHNLFLLMAVTGGVPLVLSFLGIILIFCWKSLKRLKNNQDLLVVCVLSAVAAFLVAAFFTPVSIPNFLLLAVFLAGLELGDKKFYSFRLPKLFGKSIIAVFGILFVICGLSLGIGDTLLNSGNHDYQDGNFASAARLFYWSRCLNPTNGLSNLLLVRSEIMLKTKSNLVVPDIKRIISLHPRQAGSYVLAADSYFYLYLSTRSPLFLDDAIRDYTTAISIDYSFPERYGQLGYYYYVKGDIPKALSLLKYSLSLDPNLTPSLILSAKIYQQENDRAQMMANLEKAFKLNPTDLKIRYLWFFAKSEPDVNKVPFNLIFQTN